MSGHPNDKCGCDHCRTVYPRDLCYRCQRSYLVVDMEGTADRAGVAHLICATCVALGRPATITLNTKEPSMPALPSVTVNTPPPPEPTVTITMSLEMARMVSKIMSYDAATIHAAVKAVDGSYISGYHMNQLRQALIAAGVS